MKPIKTLLILIALTFSLIGCLPADNFSPPVPGTPADQPAQGTVPRAANYACVPQDTPRQVARLLRVVDGDTIEVELDGRSERVRYIGVDTPEREDPFYSEATAKNQALLSGEFLLLVNDVSETDQYGRLLRYVFASGDTFVNYELVSAGYAYSLTYPPDVACAEVFLQTQTEARQQNRGLWEPLSSADGQSAAHGVIIDLIYFDGQVPQVESDEYIVIKNTGTDPVEITNWKITAGSRRQAFTFPAFTLGAGQSCRVYTNETHPESCGFSFGWADPVWSNKGECGNLYDAQGFLVDSYCYE